MDLSFGDGGTKLVCVTFCNWSLGCSEGFRGYGKTPWQARQPAHWRIMIWASESNCLQ